MPKNKRLVYSIGPGGPGAEKLQAASGSGPPASRPPSQQAPRVRRERSGRKGKTVTVAEPLVLVREDARALLGELKRACGTGGAAKETTARDGTAAFALELQGDHVAQVVEELARRGYPVKRSGG